VISIQKSSVIHLRILLGFTPAGLGRVGQCGQHRSQGRRPWPNCRCGIARPDLLASVWPSRLVAPPPEDCLIHRPGCAVPDGGPCAAIPDDVVRGGAHIPMLKYSTADEERGSWRFNTFSSQTWVFALQKETYPSFCTRQLVFAKLLLLPTSIYST